MREAQKNAISAAPAPTTRKKPPPLPIEPTPPAADDRAEVPIGRGRSAQSGGFPVFPVLLTGAGLIVGLIGGLMIWKFQSADAQPAKPAIAQQVPDQQDEAPAANALPGGQHEAKPDNDVPVKLPTEETPSALPKQKEAKPDNDVPTKPAPGPGHPTWSLMPLVDLNVDVIEGKGKWKRQDQKLICEVGHFLPRIQIRYVPPEEYDFSVTFSQPRQRNGICLIMPKPGGGTFFWTVGFHNGSGYGFCPEGKSHRGGDIGGLIDGVSMYTTTVQVRRNGVKGLLDGQLLINHPTNFRDLTNDGWHKMPNDRVLGVGCDDPTTFHRIEIVEITAPARRSGEFVTRLSEHCPKIKV